MNESEFEVALEAIRLRLQDKALHVQFMPMSPQAGALRWEILENGERVGAIRYWKINRLLVEIQTLDPRHKPILDRAFVEAGFPIVEATDVELSQPEPEPEPESEPAPEPEPEPWEKISNADHREFVRVWREEKGNVNAIDEFFPNLQEKSSIYRKSVRMRKLYGPELVPYIKDFH